MKILYLILFADVLTYLIDSSFFFAAVNFCRVLIVNQSQSSLKRMEVSIALSSDSRALSVKFVYALVNVFAILGALVHSLIFFGNDLKDLVTAG